MDRRGPTAVVPRRDISVWATMARRFAVERGALVATAGRAFGIGRYPLVQSDFSARRDRYEATPGPPR